MEPLEPGMASVAPVGAARRGEDLFPDDIFLHILSKLDDNLVHLFCVSMVCGYWRELSRSLEAFDMPDPFCTKHDTVECPCTSDALCTLISRSRGFRFLQLHHTDPRIWTTLKTSDAISSNLSEVRLWLHFDQEVVDLASVFSKCINLRELNVGDSQVVWIRCSSLPVLPKLKKCTLSLETKLSTLEDFLKNSPFLEYLRLQVRLDSGRLNLQLPRVKHLEVGGFEGTVTLAAPKLCELVFERVFEFVMSGVNHGITTAKINGPSNVLLGFQTLSRLHLTGPFNATSQVLHFLTRNQVPRLKHLSLMPFFTEDIGFVKISWFFEQLDHLTELEVNLAILAIFDCEQEQLAFKHLKLFKVWLLNDESENTGFDEDEEDAILRSTETLLAAAPDAEFVLHAPSNASIEMPPGIHLVKSLTDLYFNRTQKSWIWPEVFDDIVQYSEPSADVELHQSHIQSKKY